MPIKYELYRKPWNKRHELVYCILKNTARSSQYLLEESNVSLEQAGGQSHNVVLYTPILNW